MGYFNHLKTLCPFSAGNVSSVHFQLVAIAWTHDETVQIRFFVIVLGGVKSLL